MLTDAEAITCPTIVELVPSVAELPICQKTLQACAPFVSKTVLDAPVINVDAERNINTAVESPSPSSVNTPLIASVGLLYAPGVIVRPAPSSTPVTVPPRLSAKAPEAAVSAASDAPPRTVDPVKAMVPDGAVALPTPIFPPAVPEIPEAVALVIPALARTAYEEAVPIFKGVSAALAEPGKKPANRATVKPITANILNL